MAAARYPTLPSGVPCYWPPLAAAKLGATSKAAAWYQQLQLQGDTLQERQPPPPKAAIGAVVAGKASTGVAILPMAGPPRLRLPPAASTANGVETRIHVPRRLRLPPAASTANGVETRINPVTGAVWPPHPPGVDCWPPHPSLLPMLAEMEQATSSSSDDEEEQHQQRQQRRLAALIKSPPAATRRRTARGVVRLQRASKGWWTASKKWWTPLKSMKHMQAMKDIGAIIKGIKKLKKIPEADLDKMKEKRAQHWNHFGYKCNRNQWHKLEEKRAEEAKTAKANEDEAIAMDNELRISRLEAKADFLGFFRHMSWN